MANELIPEDAEHPNILHALVRKRAELAGQIEHNQLELRRLIAALDHIDGSIKIFDPNIDITRIAPVSPRHAAFKGEVSRIVFDTLREAREPVTSRDIALRLMEERGLNPDDRVLLIIMVMPDSFTGYAAGQYVIPRIERALWGRLAALGLPYRLDYGDYATVPINPAPSGIRWGYPINVKYTLQQDFLICRGVTTTGYGAVDLDVQLVGHAATIVAFPGRGPLAHCWADDRIDQIALTGIGQGNLETWVKIGVNRHIEATRSWLP